MHDELTSLARRKRLSLSVCVARQPNCATVARMDPRIAKCLLLSKVLVADGIMTENERAFLDRAMGKMGLAPHERKTVLDLTGWDEAEAALMGISNEDKQGLVQQLTDAASADGRLSPLEMANRISAALDVRG